MLPKNSRKNSAKAGVYPKHKCLGFTPKGIFDKFKGICEFHDLLLFYETWIFPSFVCLAHVKKWCNRDLGWKKETEF